MACQPSTYITYEIVTLGCVEKEALFSLYVSQANHHHKYICVYVCVPSLQRQNKSKKLKNKLKSFRWAYMYTYVFFVVGSLYIAKIKWAKPPFILSTDKLHIFKEVCMQQPIHAKKRFLHHISIHLFNFSSVLHLTPIYMKDMCHFFSQLIIGVVQPWHLPAHAPKDKQRENTWWDQRQLY